MAVTIPGYKILDTLGKGGMATVFLAEHELFQRKVALKVMAHGLSDDSSFGDRFMREARIVSQLVHPNIVTVYDVGVHDGSYYLSMEFIDGQDLKHARKGLSLEQKIGVVLDIAKALEYAGNKGYVHRDIKPENIMLYTHDSRAVLTDFGIARAAELEASVTLTGTAIGTPHYMSPEQAKGQPVDIRSDIYGLGVVFYLLLVGCVPYDAESAVAIGIKHITDPVPELPDGLTSLQPIINKMMAKLPEDRYQRPGELVDDLRSIDMPQLIDAANEAYAKAEASRSEVSADAPTIVSRPPPSAAVTTTSHEARTRIRALEEEDDPTPVVAETRYFPEDESSSLWPWAGGVFVLLTVAGVIFYTQQPERVDRWFAAATNVLSGEPAVYEPQYEPLPEGRGAVQTPNEESAPVPETGVDATPGSLASDDSPSADTAPAESPAQASADTVSETGSEPLDETQVLISQWLAEGERYLAEGALTGPADANARNSFLQVLEVAPENSAAREGLSDVASRLAERAAESMAEGELDEAERLLRAGKQTDPSHPRIASLQESLEERRADSKRQERVVRFLEQGEAHLREGDYFTPEQESAHYHFSQALELAPDNEQAREGISRTIEDFETRLFNLLAEEHVGPVRELLQAAQRQRPDDERLVALEMRVEEAIAERELARQPQVSSIEVTGVPGAVAASDGSSVVADRTIFVSFEYRNFTGANSVIHAILMDGSRTVQIAQVPVVLSGDEGDKTFRIDRPVQGFSPGRYTVDLMLQGNRLATRDFQVR